MQCLFRHLFCSMYTRGILTFLCTLLCILLCILLFLNPFSHIPSQAQRNPAPHIGGNSSSASATPFSSLASMTTTAPSATASLNAATCRRWTDEEQGVSFQSLSLHSVTSAASVVATCKMWHPQISTLDTRLLVVVPTRDSGEEALTL